MTAPYEAFIIGPAAEGEGARERFSMVYVEVRRRHRSDSGPNPEVWNPTMMPDGRSGEWRFRQCLKALFESPACFVYLMPGWEACPFAQAQHAVAKALGRVIVNL